MGDNVVDLVYLEYGEGTGFLIGGDGNGGAKKKGIAIFHAVPEGNKRP